MARDFYCRTNEPVVETKAGKLRGFYLDGVFIFRGVDYAKVTKRFMPAEPVDSWEGIKEATSYGNVSPLMNPNSPNYDLLIPHRFWTENENCLNLNVWSTKLDKKAKKPVMVWLHGGGYSAGSSIEMIAYEGENMAKYGDVVCVTVNHRLNILGYFDLSSFGEEFKNSGNAGQEDIVMALKWVHDNIEAFGGDPDNVTIFGQSGGGGKVISLLQTPAADGLFHKGIMMSGGAGRKRVNVRHDKETAEEMIKVLGGTDVSILQEVSYDELCKAYKAITPALKARGIEVGPRGPVSWGPTQNDWYVGDPWDVGYTEHAKTVPLLVGSVIAETGFTRAVEDMDEVPVEKRKEMICDIYGEAEGTRLIEKFKAAFPEKNELTLIPISPRAGVLDFMTKRAEDCSAPTWNWLFCYDFPYHGGLPAWHCSDIPFAFHNTDLVPICNEHNVSDGLEQAFFGSFMAFAHTGTPNGKGLAKWDPYTVDHHATMFFDGHSEQGIDKDAELQKEMDGVVPEAFAAFSVKKVTF